MKGNEVDKEKKSQRSKYYGRSVARWRVKIQLTGVNELNCRKISSSGHAAALASEGH